MTTLKDYSTITVEAEALDLLALWSAYLWDLTADTPYDMVERTKLLLRANDRPPPRPPDKPGPVVKS